jgi:DNA gyrase inhibitor GyrI
MKSLQNRYNLIKEGKGNKEIFLKEVKAEFPQYISNVQTFDQVIHSLVEKGIINESMVLVSANRPETPDWFKIFQENTETVKAELKDTDKSVTEKETAGYNYEDKKNNNNISTAQILEGYYAEMKDPKNAEKTEDEIKAIVFKNLEKDPLFYVKNAAFGVKGIGYSDNHPGLGPTKEVTGKYKSSGMEPVNLNEAKKRAIEKHIAEIEKMGEVAAWGHRIGKIQEKIDELTNKMTVTEGDDVKDMVDKKAVKELKKDIALLTKKKALYEKQKAKAAGKVKDKSVMQTAAGEGTTVMEKEEKPFTPPADPIGDRIKASMKRDTAPKPKKESWTGMVRELINTKNLKVK